MRFDPRLFPPESPSVYRPGEDSLLLLESILLHPGERFLEVGTGGGLIALHAARLGPAVATDVNREATALARRGARKNGLPLEVVRTDLAAGLRGTFDVIAFNPPYLEGCPRDERDRAWAGGEWGSELSIRFLRDLPRILRPGGRAYLLLSRANRTARVLADSSFRSRVVSGKRLFFEDLEVLELRRRDP